MNKHLVLHQEPSHIVNRHYLYMMLQSATFMVILNDFQITTTSRIVTCYDKSQMHLLHIIKCNLFDLSARKLYVHKNKKLVYLHVYTQRPCLPVSNPSTKTILGQKIFKYASCNRGIQIFY